MEGVEEISAEELFDIFHLQQNLVDIEVHSLENGELESADQARRTRHKVNKLLFGENPGKPQYLCQYKHTLSSRMEMMELLEKWYREGDEEMVEFAKKKIDELGAKLIELIGKIREKDLEIKEK